MKIVEISYERTVSENYQSRKFGMKAIPEEGEHPDMCAQFLIERVHTHLGLKPNAAASPTVRMINEACSVRKP